MSIPSEASTQSVREVGDRRLRFVMLSRFGLGGTAKSTWAPGPSPRSETVEFKPSATFGFDLRVEKPLHRYFSIGGLLSNYWVGGMNDYALYVSVLAKPRYTFRLGKREGEAYVAVQFGGSLLVNKVVFLSGSVSGDLETRSEIRDPSGGFNVGVAPGFQVFVAEHVAWVFEVGYAYSWFRTDVIVSRFTLGQATIRTGLAFAF